MTAAEIAAALGGIRREGRSWRWSVPAEVLDQHAGDRRTVEKVRKRGQLVGVGGGALPLPPPRLPLRIRERHHGGTTASKVAMADCMSAR